MLKLLLVFAILAIANSLPIEQDENVPLTNPAPSEIEISTPVPKPTESESSVLNPELEKHEEAIQEPIKGDTPAENEVSMHNPEPENHEEPVVEAVPAEAPGEVSTINTESDNHEKPIVETVPVTGEVSTINPEPDNHEKPIVETVPATGEVSTIKPELVNHEEPIIEAVPAATSGEISTINPEPDKHEEPIDGSVPTPIEISTLSPESDKHEKPIQPIEVISKPGDTVPPSLTPGDSDEDDAELEAALDQFFQFLNLTDSDEMEDVIIGSILMEMFEGLDEILTALEHMADFTGEEKGSQVLLKRINDMNIFENKPVLSPALLIDQNQENKENEENEDDSPARACKAEKGLPGVCVPFYLCETTSRRENVNEIPVDVDSNTCPTALEVCCSSDHLQLGTGAGLRKDK